MTLVFAKSSFSNDKRLSSNGIDLTDDNKNKARKANCNSTFACLQLEVLLAKSKQANAKTKMLLLLLPVLELKTQVSKN